MSEFLQKHILSIFKSNPFTEYNSKNIYSHIHGGIVKDKELQANIRATLHNLHKDGIIQKTNRINYKLSDSQLKHHTGTIEIKSSLIGFVKFTDTYDILIHPHDVISNNVLDGDTVEVRYYYKDSYYDRKSRPYGEIVRIVKRTNKPVIGIAVVKEFHTFIETNERYHSVFIPKEATKGVKNGQKVAIRITDWPKESRNPFGKIMDILGDAGDNDTEMNAILAEFDLPYNYPKRLEKKAEKIEPGIDSAEIAKRRDMRGICTFTIDPATAKDYDDALSIRKLDNGNYEVGVHIADVSFYVKQGDDIDGEGYQRATSIYLVDRTIPMLPEKLSNFLCSLRPDEDKLCFSAIFELDNNAEIKSSWFGKTVIRSIRRFTYDETQDIIEGKSSELESEIKNLNQLAQKLREERMTKNTIIFSNDEPQFELDDKGKPTKIFFKENKESNQLIEEFMLLANRKVAEFINQMHKPFVYRIHDKPSTDKFETFCSVVNMLGIRVQMRKSSEIGKELSKVLNKVKGKPEERFISNLALRTMAKAKYSTKNIGHYGLDFKYYTHFTSPIRRYPDIMVHRLLDSYLNHEEVQYANKLEEFSIHCSDQEIIAANAERASIKYKMVEFMADKIGEEYEGTITGLNDSGIYVELDTNRIEGMIPINQINPKYFYEYDRRNLRIESCMSDISYYMGDRLSVMIKEINLNKKQLILKLLEKIS